ncbi:maltose/maltodextrin ABC transporter permease protein MalF [Photobacterium aphoticum]|uniref:Maltose/maltodextrin ABC transporter permease protein MalF n=1 Tax=Photobacterium aphoticum TaxID=754436 RepID=A0A090R4J6_9GAMM|nr:maltose/maltodextrin ABC transporter permease protein MalF [Photobacterium aphoticum]
MLMYAQGEIPFALLTVFLTALALYIFGSKKRTPTVIFIRVLPGWWCLLFSR